MHYNDPLSQLESIAMYLLLNMFHFSHALFPNGGRWKGGQALPINVFYGVFLFPA